MGIVYGYCRSSTTENRQEVMRQVEDLKRKGINEENIFYEYGTGRKIDRIKLQQLLKLVDQGDTIACTELSRISRSVKHLTEIIDICMKKKVKLEIGDLSISYNEKGELTAQSTFIITMLGAVAQMESDLSSERIKSGMEYKKNKEGIKFGRPEVTYNNLPKKFIEVYQKVLLKQINMSELIKITGLSRQTCYKYREIYNDYHTSIKK